MKRSSLLSVCAALLVCVPVEAQQIRGRVVVQGTDEPVAAATVALLDAGLNPVATARTDPTGAFIFGRLGPGQYQLQADREGVQSAISAIEVVTPGEAAIVIEMPSPLLVLAMTCGPLADPAGTTVLVGAVHDGASGVALPGARVAVAWGDGQLDVLTGPSGHYRFCGVPVARDLVLTASALGRGAEHAIRLSAGAVSRVDVGVELGAIQFAVAVVGRTPAQGRNSNLTIRLRDAASGRSLPGAAVWLGNTSLATFSNGSGIVRLDGVPGGDHELRVEMVGYGSRSMAINVPQGENLHVDVRVPAVPIALEPISVQSHMRSEFRTPREANTRVDIIAGANMADAEDRGAQVVDLLRGSFPGLFIHEGVYATLHHPELQFILCIESVRRLDRLRLPDGVQEPFCDMVTVVIDGVPTFDPGQHLRNLSVRDFESIEYLGPLDAGLRYGNRASQSGALVLWSRGQGPHRSPSRHKD